VCVNPVSEVCCWHETEKTVQWLNCGTNTISNGEQSEVFLDFNDHVRKFKLYS
jgi:hypothetical protein